MHELSLHLLDIVQNSLRAGARRVQITIDADRAADHLIIGVRDDGSGMDAELLSRIADPFTTTRTTRRVGLGIPLLGEQCRLTGGALDIQSKPGAGTFLKAMLGLSHIDRTPLGDLASTFGILVQSDPRIDYRLELSAGKNRFVLDLADVRRELDGLALDHPDVLNWLRQTVEDGTQSVFGGILPEMPR